MAGPVRVYVDYISPYAHLAWAACVRLTARTGHALVPEPVLFAGLLNHYGQVRVCHGKCVRVC
jgi:2-hydroxychromene-2-carboxylate isomerase